MKRTMQILLLSLMGISILPQASFAKTEIMKSPNGRYIYFSYPWSEACHFYADQNTALKEVFSEVLSDVNKTSAELTTVRIGDLPTNGTFLSTVAKISKNMPTYMKAVNQRVPHSGVGGLCPDGFLLNFMGIKGAANVLGPIAIGAQTAIGVVVVPQVVKRIDVKTGKVATFRFRADWSVVVNAKANVSGGVDTGVGVRVGVGAIWGIDRAKDFRGSVVSVSGTVQALGGFSIQLGRMYQTSPGVLTQHQTGNVFTFAQVMFDAGAQADAAVHLEGGKYVLLDDVMQSVFGAGEAASGETTVSTVDPTPTKMDPPAVTPTPGV